MTDAILKLENIVEVLSNRDIYNKSMVFTQEINAVLWQIAEAMAGPTVPGPGWLKGVLSECMVDEVPRNSG